MLASLTLHPIDADVIGRDTHRLRGADGEIVALETGCTAITSPSYGSILPGIGRYIEQANPDTIYCNQDAKGYTLLTLRPGSARVDYRTVSTVTDKTFEAGDFEMAKKIYQNVMVYRMKRQGAKAYEIGAIHNSLGVMQYNEGDYDKAIELDAEFAEAYSNRGSVYERSGNYQRALADYGKAIELKPQSIEAYYNRGVVYQRSGNHQQAIKDYDSVIELEPRFKPAYYNRGLAYDKSGNHQRAIKDYIKAIELDPKFALAYVRLAKDYEKQEQYEAAIEAWKKVSEIGPQQHEAKKNLTRLRALTHQ